MTFVLAARGFLILYNLAINVIVNSGPRDVQIYEVESKDWLQREKEAEMLLRPVSFRTY